MSEPSTTQLQLMPCLNRRILVIDDNAAIHEDFRKVLSGSQAQGQDMLELLESQVLGNAATPATPQFELDTALQGEEGVQKVQAAMENGRPYALAFVDMRMPPGWDGVQTIEHLWQADPSLQVVICSAHSDYEWNDVVARLNYSDKLLVLRKPFEPIEVQQCASALCRKWHNERLVRGHVRSLEKMVAARTRGLEDANRQLRHMATHDSLTGLPNRALLDDRLQQAMAQALRQDQRFAVLVCDLDRFKLVNDSMGHHAGDLFLQEIARRLSACVREGDTLARQGGDEFVFVLGPPAGEAEAEAVSQRAVAALALPTRIDGIDIHTSASFGVAVFPRDGERAETLLANADAAMYHAKQHGSGIRRFSASMGDTATYRLRLESELHHALTAEQFELHYQPKVDVRTGAVRSAEALLRWRHPQRGYVPPGDFISIVEETGQIGPIGIWVLQQACRQASAWRELGLPPVRVAVNISAVQFHQPGLVECVCRALRDARLDARYLELELTESCVMTNPEESIAILEELSRMGVLVSVDDFGTGHSSMSYLRRFPIDKLKIDRTFVTGMDTHAEDAAIVRAIVALAHGLRLKVVAEGVETAAQLDALREMGCDQYQGFYCSPALPADRFERLLRLQSAKLPADVLQDMDETCSKLTAIRPVAGA
ncbi:MAG TPA: EAL domain-containing protein [Steroidobacteraceae bacterium]|nr:EAL domain-containing protein [Steroidobacteraceae bacterium]